MNRKNVFQYEVATGRWTLPVVVVLFLIVHLLTYRGWMDLWTAGVELLTAYLLVEMNNRFALIRVRTTLPSSFFLLCCLGFQHHIHPFAWGLLPLFCGLIFSLFHTYERAHSPVAVFNAFFCIGMMVALHAFLIVLVPLVFFYMLYLRSLSMRTFFAGCLGLVTPFLAMGVWAVYEGNQALYANSILSWRPEFFHFDKVSPFLWVVWGMWLLIYVVSSLEHLFYAFQDKVQTRIYLRFFWMTLLVLHLIIGVEPGLIAWLLPVHALLCSILFAHQFSQNYTLFTRIAFDVILLALVALIIMNRWMPGFLI